jgi:hypothetical protein
MKIENLIKDLNNFRLYFLQFLVIKTLDPYPERIHLKCWIWIRIQYTGWRGSIIRRRKKCKIVMRMFSQTFLAQLEENFNTWIRLWQPNEYGYFPDSQPCSI